MKKLLFVIPSLDVGGTLTALSAIIDNLKQHFSISVFALSHDGNTDVIFNDMLLKRDDLIHAYYCNWSSASKFGKCKILLVKILKRTCALLSIDFEKVLALKLVKKHDGYYDYVIGFQEGCVTKIVSYFKESIKIAWVHCDYSRCISHGYELDVYERYHKIVCVSKYTEEVFCRIYPTISNKVSYVYNLIDLNQIMIKSIERIYDDRFFNDKFTIVSIGRLDPVKRFESIPGLAKYLVDNNCDFRWYIIGPKSSNDVYLQIKDAIDRNNVSDYVFYLGNQYNPYPYIAHSDLLVTLSSSEACPMIFNEAKALGIPVLTTDFGSALEFINDGQNGYVVPFNTIKVYLLKLLTSKSTYEAIKGGMRQTEYNNLTAIHKLIELFK